MVDTGLELWVLSDTPLERLRKGVRRTRFVLALIFKGPMPGQVNPLFEPKVAVIRKEHMLELAHPAT